MKLLNVKEVAEILQVAKQTVYNLIYENKLKGTKVGRAVRIREKELERFIEDNTGTIDTKEKEPEDTEPVKEDTKEKEPDIKENNSDKTDKKDLINQISFEEEGEPKEKDSDYMTVREASKQLDKSKRTIQRYCKQGKLEGYKDGKNWKVSRGSIKKYQER